MNLIVVVDSKKNWEMNVSGENFGMAKDYWVVAEVVVEVVAEVADSFYK
jgi:hypothetical protein